MKIVIATLLILSLFSCSYGMSFGFNLARHKRECFTESFNPNTLVKGQFSANDKDYHSLVVTILNEAGAPVYYTNELTGQTVKFSFTTNDEGAVNICVENRGEKYMKIYFELLSGIEAGDTTGVASDEDLKPIERQLLQLDRTMKSIKTTTSYIVNREEEKITQADTISFKLYLFSIITMITMAAISFLQAKYLKNFFRSKKLI